MKMAIEPMVKPQRMHLVWPSIYLMSSRMSSDVFRKNSLSLRVIPSSAGSGYLTGRLQ